MDKKTKKVKAWAVVNHSLKRSWRVPNVFASKDEAKGNLINWNDKIHRCEIIYLD